MTEIGWWLAKISRTSARTTMPRISAATPRLFRKASSLTPKALITVDTSRAMIARNDHVFRNGTGLAAGEVDPEQRGQD